MKYKDTLLKMNSIVIVLVVNIMIFLQTIVCYAQNVIPKINMLDNEKIKVQLEYYDDTNPFPPTIGNWNSTAPPNYPNNTWNIDDDEIVGTGITLTECLDRSYSLSVEVNNNSITQFFTICKRQSICFPSHTGVPRDRRPPIIDGNITNDVGWTGAFRLNFDYGSNPSDVTIQTLKHAADNYIYLSFEVENLPAADDAIIICLRPKVVYTLSNLDDNITAQAEETRMILIKPSIGTECNPDVRYFRNSDNWVEITGGINNDQICVSPTANGWNVELQLPTTDVLAGGAGDWITLENDFLFYTNVCAVTNTNVNTVSEYIWPNNNPLIEGDILSYPNYQNDFGVAHKGPGSTTDCQGIYMVNYSDIYTGNTPNHEIKFKEPPLTNDITNTLNARVANTSSNQAPGVNVTFKIANWGLSNPWSIVPNGTTTPPEGISNTSSIPGNGDHVFNIDWLLTPGQITNYNTPTEKHQCILAELNADPNVNIISKSRVRNMDFVSASKFSRFATIGTNDFGPLPKDKDKHKVLLKVFKKENPKPYDNTTITDSSKLAGSKKARITKKDELATCLNYTVHGYSYTDKELIIDGTAYKIVIPRGAYGYIVCHEGFVNKWNTKFKGAEKIRKNIYQLEIEPGGSAIVEDIVKPIGKRWSLSFHVGNAIPTGTLANNFESGSAWLGDFGYHFSENWALVTFVGFNDFKSNSSGVADNYLINISPNLRWYPFNSRLSLYLGVGPGYYIPESGDSEFGANGGIGLNFEANNTLNFELGTEYHQLFDSNTEYWQPHFGIILRF